MKWLWDNFAGALLIPLVLGPIWLLSLFPIGRAIIIGVGLLIFFGVTWWAFTSDGLQRRAHRINPNTGLPRSTPYPYWTESDNQDND